MELSDRDRKLIGVGAAVLLIGAWLTFRKTGGPGTNSNGEAPAKEQYQSPVMQSMNGPGSMLGLTPEGNLSWYSVFLHFFDPWNGVPCANRDDYGFHVRLKYPTVSGTNVNTLIHHGYSPLMVPSVQDYAWYVRPPADDEFVG